jgi:threonine aldolase
MLDAMRHAEMGDDMMQADPTVNKLEALAAERVGMEAALFVPSGTMGNLVSLMVHGRPGDMVFHGEKSHVTNYEAGGLSGIASLMPYALPDDNGYIKPEDLIAAIHPEDVHLPRPTILCIENTHNLTGGRITPIDHHAKLCATARDLGLKVHLDGARIFNASVASGTPVSDYAAHVDSLTFCLSKGLSCPIGSIVAGSAEFVHEARRCRKRLGGAMRQAGCIAAAGIVALETMVDRLAKDHANARLLAKGLSALPGFRVDMDAVETNMVYVDIADTGMKSDILAARLKDGGVLVSAMSPFIRLVLHRHIDTAAVKEALERIKAALT